MMIIIRIILYFFFKEQYLSSDFLVEKEFSRIIEKESSQLSQRHCLKNKTGEDDVIMHNEDDENSTSHNADYNYHGKLFLF